MSTRRRTGFTLIELLTVIAIISILSAITFSVLPRIREQAKLRRLDGVFHGLQNALALYATQKGQGSYPPAYGYLSPAARGKAVGTLTDADYVLKPWGTFISLNKATDIYDVFGRGTDANQNQILELLEYSPIGQGDSVTDKVTYMNTLYRGDKNAVIAEYNAQIDSKQVPVRYIPVNTGQFKRAKRYWLEEARDPLASSWNTNSPSLAGMSFPPPKYDAYVLMSVGPRENSFDIFGDAPSGAPTEYAYHIAALRAYFLATRDLNDDNKLDFDFEQSNDERGLTFSVKLPNGETYGADNRLPSRTYPEGYGPKIFASN